MDGMRKFTLLGASMRGLQEHSSAGIRKSPCELVFTCVRTGTASWLGQLVSGCRAIEED
jgi:hypothetical protein